MKRRIIVSVIWLTLLLSTSSCVGPLKRWLSTDNKQQKTEGKVDKNKEETIDKARQFVHGTGTALDLDPTPSKYSEVAENLNKRAELTLGPPSYQDVLTINKIVQGLLSTNEQIKIEAQKELSIKDNEIVGLQSQLEGLQGKLEKIQKEKDELGLTHSKLANTFSNIKKWFWIIVWVVIGGVGLMLMSQFLSVLLPPPYNGVFSIIGLLLGSIGRLIFKIVPSSQKFASVVDKSVHDTSEQTLKSLVSALQEIRNKQVKLEDLKKMPELKLAHLIDGILKDKTDMQITRPKITEIKQKMGYV